MTIQHDHPRYQSIDSVLDLAPVMRPMLMSWFALVVLHLATFPFRFPFTDIKVIRIFNLNAESGIGTWFSVVILATGGLLALATARQIRSQDIGLAAGWGLVGAIMVAMSVEEVILLHEGTTSHLRTMFGTSGYLHYAWVLIGASLALIVLLAGWPLIRRLTPPIRRQLLVAAAIFLLGAVGSELIGGKIAGEGRQDTFAYAVTVAIEEGLEILGVLVGIDALLRFRRQARLHLAI